jgi:hypothetical protein
VRVSLGTVRIGGGADGPRLYGVGTQVRSSCNKMLCGSVEDARSSAAAECSRTRTASKPFFPQTAGESAPGGDNHFPQARRIAALFDRISSQMRAAVAGAFQTSRSVGPQPSPEAGRSWFAPGILTGSVRHIAAPHPPQWRGWPTLRKPGRVLVGYSMSSGRQHTGTSPSARPRRGLMGGGPASNIAKAFDAQVGGQSEEAGFQTVAPQGLER